MEYFIHKPEERKTILVDLDIDFDSALKDFVGPLNLKTIAATIRTARCHPKDNYNHKEGRKVARVATAQDTYYTISSVYISHDIINIKLYPSVGEDKLTLTKYRDSGKVIIT